MKVKGDLEGLLYPLSATGGRPPCQGGQKMQGQELLAFLFSIRFL